MDLSRLRRFSFCPQSNPNTLYWHIFASCQCISVSSAFAFVASNVALELVDKHIFQPSERFLLVVRVGECLTDAFSRRGDVPSSLGPSRTSAVWAVDLQQDRGPCPWADGGVSAF